MGQRTLLGSSGPWRGPVRQGLLMGHDERMRELVSGRPGDQKSLCSGLS